MHPFEKLMGDLQVDYTWNSGCTLGRALCSAPHDVLSEVEVSFGLPRRLLEGLVEVYVRVFLYISG